MKKNNNSNFVCRICKTGFRFSNRISVYRISINIPNTYRVVYTHTYMPAHTHTHLQTHIFLSHTRHERNGPEKFLVVDWNNDAVELQHISNAIEQLDGTLPVGTNRRHLSTIRGRDLQRTHSLMQQLVRHLDQLMSTCATQQNTIISSRNNVIT